ncbi:hypothetical protein AX777_05815 [Sphingobium yanoikuyae]|uniref:Uncharacterized protein n=2 Tax=Sphingobium yanoikuyae TaxID=13690 RepID=A0A177JNJ4_SPHYA|nr:hypothetical protein AX777_05815 [Sphingobium yanoikuyae]
MDVRPYSDEYAYAYVSVSDDQHQEFIDWLAQNNCDVDDYVDGEWYQMIVNIHGKGGAARFKLTWGGQESEADKRADAAKKEFLKALLGGAA